MGGQTLVEVNKNLAEYLSSHGVSPDDVTDHVARTGTLRGMAGVPRELSKLFVTALDIPLERHLAIQAAFQRHTDNSVSKTVNLPASAQGSDVAKAYRAAWRLGLKGITVFRYGSRSAQVLELGSGEEPYYYDHSSRCDPLECRV
jgi:ribonucleoside-diphosphate reductase alpha chain